MIYRDYKKWTSMFPQRLKRVIEYRGLTQRELALRTGLSESTISLILHGRQLPRAGGLIALADALDCSVDYLLGARGGDIPHD